jgi:hypothetical protein
VLVAPTTRHHHTQVNPEQLDRVTLAVAVTFWVAHLVVAVAVELAM